MLFKLSRRFAHKWIPPLGHDTHIKIYNCQMKEKVPFIVRNKNFVTWYTCGPTVYDTAHLGHASCFVKVDIIQRILHSIYGLNVAHVMNITDIDDKIIARSKALKIDLVEMTRRHEEEFLSDLRRLNVKPAWKVVRVTDHMELIVKFIQQLLDLSVAYQKSDGVYFDLKAYEGAYGKLQNIPIETITDFALWKVKRDGEPSWKARFGEGRPGWHVECSALASHYLGENIDVHAGGIDLRFPHHENEEAQSCAYHSKPQWVNYWLHTGHLYTAHSEDKMSKSLGNTLNISDFLNSYDGDTFRMACLMSSYRNRMDFGEEYMHTANGYLQTHRNFLDEAKARLSGEVRVHLDRDILMKKLDMLISEVTSYLNNDFNTSLCLKSVNSTIGFLNKYFADSNINVDIDYDQQDSNLVLHAICSYISDLYSNFGLNIKENAIDEEKMNELMNVFVGFRNKIRLEALQTKNCDLLDACDQARNDANKLGYKIIDRKIKSW